MLKPSKFTINNNNNGKPANIKVGNNTGSI
jgi:hypothetical protein